MTRSEGLAMAKEGRVRMARWLNEQSYVFQSPGGEVINVITLYRRLSRSSAKGEP